MSEIEHPFSKAFAILTKQYLSILNSQLKDLPIDRYQYSLLLIAQSTGTIGQKELAELLFADKVTVVRIIDYFEKLELVKRETCNEDRRCHLLHITKKAEPLIPLIEAAIKTTNEIFLSFIDPAFREEFNTQIQHLTQQVKEIPGDRFDFLFDKITHTDDHE